MSRKPHFVIDGSNLATESRTAPSLAQLDEAVRAFRAEYRDGTVTVVVDASFEHRIDPAEEHAFHKAEAKGDVVSPPAGAIGRGDGFLLQIADRTGATVVSNDSFQEFHGEYVWLFDVGRLIGGKPVTGVGWIFSLRQPVRGPRSRRATREKDKEATAPKKVRTPNVVTAAIAKATADALEPAKAGRRRSRGGGQGPPPGAVNDPHPFLAFLVEHRLGSKVDATVDEFTSHGAFVVADGARAYVPLAALGDPPPRSAKTVLKKGETRTFVVQAIDGPRRAIELALPEWAHVAGAPSEETVEAVTKPRTVSKGAGTRKSARKPSAKDAKPVDKAAPVKRAVPVKKAAPPHKKAAPVKRTGGRGPRKRR